MILQEKIKALNPCNECPRRENCHVTSREDCNAWNQWARTSWRWVCREIKEALSK